MRLLRKLLVLIFVRRKAQAHASAVLANRARSKTGSAQKSGPVAAKPASADVAAVPVPAESTAKFEPDGDKIKPTVSARPGSARELLIAEALAVRRSREAEWDALTPAQQSRAIVALGEGMAAIVKTFRPA